MVDSLSKPNIGFLDFIQKNLSTKFNNEVKNPSNPLDFQSVTGGEYKAQVQIHRGVLIHDY
jgi:hypothetical protein